jgi:radical SAM protein with 4Fe4S-binding SPASM domain
MVIMRRNLHELPDLVRLAHEWGVEELFVQHLAHDFQESTLPLQYRPMREFVDNQTLLHDDPARVDSYFTTAADLAASLGFRLRLPRVRPRPYRAGTPGAVRCDWPWRGSYISYNGDAMPCCMISTPDRFTLGNVLEQGVAEVWNGAPYESFRRELQSDRPPNICASCSVYHGTF